MRKGLFNIGLAITFVMLVHWSMDFKYIQFLDLRTMLILVLATFILVVLGVNNWKVRLTDRFRMHLFMVATLLMVLEVFETLANIGDYSQLLNELTLDMKPLVFAMCIYLPVKNILEQISDEYTTKVIEESKITSKQDQLTPQKPNLTRRETEIFDLLIMDLSNKEIGEKLYISEATVKKHAQNIYKKSLASNRKELVSRYGSRQ